MYSKKVCILGAPAVGKSSLIRRFLGAEFSETYHATTGADIKKVVLELEADKVQLMLWDIQGMDESAHGFTHYLKGAAAIIYVVDGTQLETLDRALELRQKSTDYLGSAVPSIMLFNKSDLAQHWEISSSMINDVEADSIFAILTSSRDGCGVDTAFNLIARVMLGKSSLVAA